MMTVDQFAWLCFTVFNLLSLIPCAIFDQMLAWGLSVLTNVVVTVVMIRWAEKSLF